MPAVDEYILTTTIPQSSAIFYTMMVTSGNIQRCSAILQITCSCNQHFVH